MAAQRSMEISVLFFGATAEIVGARERKMTVADGSTVRSVLGPIEDAFPNLASHRLLIAVNEEYADADTPLQAGDQVAFFTAVSGG